MAPRLRLRLLRDLLTTDPQRVGTDTYLLQERRSARRRWRVKKLDATSVLLQRRGDSTRAVTQIGRTDLRTHLVHDPVVTGDQMSRWQQAVGGHLGHLFVAWLLDDLAINIVVDVGANEGQFARGLRAAGYTGRIVSFEPVAAVADRLRQHSASDAAWHVHQVALGEEDSTASIQVAAQSKVSSLLPASDFGRQWTDGLRDTTSQEVQVRRLDGLWNVITNGIDDPRPFLKMDTQGFDTATFRGAGPYVERFLAMQSEVSFVPLYEGMPRLPEQLELYEAAGFETAGIFPVSRHAKTRRLLEADLVMVRATASTPSGSS